MRVNSALLLFFGILLVFAPALKDWLYDGDKTWLRHHLVWLMVILCIYLNSRRYSKNGR
jgi:Mn2+/Fe2+ NRAMP family transporter